MKLITDSSALLTPQQQDELDITVFPLCVTLGKDTYREFEDLDSQQLLERIRQGEIPYSSQPNLGAKLDYYEESGEPILDITIAQGLSGTYDMACMAREQAENKDNIHVFNSTTLCGPHQAMVLAAKKMMDAGKDIEEIKENLAKMAATDRSYLVPMDFSFLMRGGRISKTAGFAGMMLKLVPITKKSEDGTILNKLGAVRTWKKAVTTILDDMASDNSIQPETVFYVADADNKERSDQAVKMIKERYPANEVITLPLSPAFITQGGPGCVSIQAITPTV